MRQHSGRQRSRQHPATTATLRCPPISAGYREAYRGIVPRYWGIARASRGTSYEKGKAGNVHTLFGREMAGLPGHIFIAPFSPTTCSREGNGDSFSYKRVLTEEGHGFNPDTKAWLVHTSDSKKTRLDFEGAYKTFIGDNKKRRAPLLPLGLPSEGLTTESRIFLGDDLVGHSQTTLKLSPSGVVIVEYAFEAVSANRRENRRASKRRPA